MPYRIQKSTSGYKVCKKKGDKKCLPGSSKSKTMAKKRISAIYMNENFTVAVNNILKRLM